MNVAAEFASQSFEPGMCAYYPYHDIITAIVASSSTILVRKNFVGYRKPAISQISIGRREHSQKS